MTKKIKKISVIVPENPFVTQMERVAPVLCALDVYDLMKWWPGVPHYPKKQADKVRSIQRSLDWKRVASIAAYLLQEEIVDASNIIRKYFESIYNPKRYEPGREWPPKVGRVIGYQRSIYPVFSNVLIHVNGVELTMDTEKSGAAHIEIDPSKNGFNLTVIDGQHRINGAYLALQIRREKDRNSKWQIPAEIFIDLDQPDEPAKYQAQIFIDVNFYQKKVDRSLVADLFPTARSGQKSLSDENRAQDIGRRLMLEDGPLVGMIQIPGIKYGVKDVIALATLVGAIRNVLPSLQNADLTSLSEQVDFLVLVLDAWLVACGRKETLEQGTKLSLGNVVYQGRILVTVLNLVPVIIWKLNKMSIPLISGKSSGALERWLKKIIMKAGFLDSNEQFLDKDSFKEEGFLGSGGIGRFRDRLWAATSEGNKKNLKRLKPENVAVIAEEVREKIIKSDKN